MGSATYCRPVQYSKQTLLTAFVQAMVTWYFMDGNVILLTRAELRQGKGPFLSAPMFVTILSVVTDLSDILCLANLGKNW